MPWPSALMNASLRVQHWKNPSGRSRGSRARYAAFSRPEKTRVATSSPSGIARTASTSTPTSPADENAYTATSSQCDTLKRSPEAARRGASAGLPRSPYTSSTACGRTPSRAASNHRNTPRATMKRWRSRSKTKRRARSRSSSESTAAPARSASDRTSKRVTMTSTASSTRLTLRVTRLSRRSRARGRSDVVSRPKTVPVSYLLRWQRNDDGLGGCCGPLVCGDTSDRAHGCCADASRLLVRACHVRGRQCTGSLPFARSSVGPEAAGQLGGTRVGGDRYLIERRNRHDAAHRIREEQALARERLLVVSALIRALHQLEHARPTDAWQYPQVERRGAQRIPIPPEQGPHGAFCYPPLRREEQRVISLRHLGLSARIGEAIPLGGFVGIRLMRLGCGDQDRRSEQRQLAHRHTGPAIAHFETQHCLSGPGERLHQRGDILGRFGKAELAERAPQTSQMPFEERDTPVVHTHGFDETVAGLVHGQASRLLAGLHRQFNPLAPLRERSVIHTNARVHQQVVQREVHMTRLESAIA